MYFTGKKRSAPDAAGEFGGAAPETVWGLRIPCAHCFIQRVTVREGFGWQPAAAPVDAADSAGTAGAATGGIRLV